MDAKKVGSSPHTRGAPGRRLALVLGIGIIPAYAGSTCRLPRTVVYWEDHPRIRGEHHRLGCAGDFGQGSSPHTRGALAAGAAEARPERIIPAYAGSTHWSGVCLDPGWDHPRIRGEHLAGLGRVIGGAGSSPHTRGAHQRTLGRHQIGGIIPAYAGSTEIRLRRPRTERDHPRIRGEHPSGARCAARAPGSSPHTRGAQLPGVAGNEVRRIIPAYAGSTISLPAGIGAVGDHPRIRGEHPHCLLLREGGEGSSPHTRGARLGVPGGRVDVGIIPAYAGSTCWCRGCRRRDGDHPRIRGEHLIVLLPLWLMLGSSPHTRGAQIYQDRHSH